MSEGVVALDPESRVFEGAIVKNELRWDKAL